MKIYILIKHEPYEGFDILGVYSSKRSALDGLGKSADYPLELLEWRLDGKQIIKRSPKGSGKLQIEYNLSWLQQVLPKMLIQDFMKSEPHTLKLP